MMEIRIIYILLFCICFAFVAAIDCPRQPCGENQLTNDGSRKCPITCAMYLNNTINQCATVCRGRFCVCRKGYYLNSEGRCVHPSQCEGYTDCSEEFGEVWTPCGTDYEETCATHGGFEELPASTSYECIPNSCVCRRDHVRDEVGRCIPREDCTIKASCGENQVWTDCGSYCNAPTCAEELGLETVNKSLCATECINNFCECVPGFFKTPENSCVPLEHCPQITQCPENEEWTNCGPEVQPTCDDIYDDMTYWKSDKCTPNTCVCIEGFVRDANNVCIPETSCPVSCGENEVQTDCGSACQPTCGTEFGTELPKYCATDCIENSCICADGYVRDDYGFCIPLEACPQAVQCGVNEEWSNCGTECPETCGTITGVEEKCYSNFCLENTCVCKPGYVRDEYNKCILKSNCKVACGVNEVWTDCGSTCSESCETALGFQPAVPCASQCIKNTCKCRPGYYRNNLGICVQLHKCSSFQKCQINEEWTNCGSKCPETCAIALGVVPPPRCSRQCVLNTCECIEGFVRNEFNKCTRLDLCSQVEDCDENEVWTNCALQDDDRYDYANNVIVQGKSFVGCKRNTCLCQPGFVRNHDDVCVDPVEFEEQFLCGENEEGVLIPYGTSINGGNYTCHCREGYVRGRSGVCVPRYNKNPSVQIRDRASQQKPTTSILKCEQGEILVNCGKNCYKTCGTILGYETESVCDGKCYLNTCECRPGYVRLTKKDRECVPARVDECKKYLQIILSAVDPDQYPEYGCGEDTYC